MSDNESETSQKEVITGSTGRKRKIVNYADQKGSDEDTSTKKDSDAGEDSDDSFGKSMEKETAEEEANQEESSESSIGEVVENGLPELESAGESESDHGDLIPNDPLPYSSWTSKSPSNRTFIPRGPGSKTDFESLHHPTIESYQTWRYHKNTTFNLENNFNLQNFEDQPWQNFTKLNKDDCKKTSTPFVFPDTENSESTSTVKVGDIIEDSKYTFSIFLGHETLQVLFLMEYILVLNLHWIDIFVPKISEVEILYKCYGRIRLPEKKLDDSMDVDDEDEEHNLRQASFMQVSKYGNSKNSALLAVGYMNSSIDLFYLNLHNKNFKLLKSINPDTEVSATSYPENNIINNSTEQSSLNTSKTQQKSHTLDSILTMDISISNFYLAISYSNTGIYIYSLKSEKFGLLLAILEDHEKSCKALKFCPWNDHLICTAGYDRRIYLTNWYANPDIPVEHLNHNFHSGVFTSMVWPFSFPGVITSTEEAFVGRKIYGSQAYWLDNGNFDGRASLIFGSEDTIWKIDYSGWSNCLVSIDDSGGCYLACLPSFRRKWSVLKSIGCG